MKKFILAGIGVLLSLGLVACGGSSNHSYSSSTTKTKQTIKASHGSTEKVTKGPLTKVGQTRNDSDAGEMTLLHIYRPTTAVADGKVNVKIDDFKIFKVEAKNSKQLKYWSDDWGTDLKSPYYYAQVDFDISNKTGQDITLEGLKSLVFDGRAYSSTNSDAYDETQGLAIPNNSTTKDTLVTFPIEKSATNTTSVGFALEEINDSAQENEVVPVMNTVTVDLTK